MFISTNTEVTGAEQHVGKFFTVVIQFHII